MLASLLLFGCGDSKPSKEEVKDFLAQQAASLNFPFQRPNPLQMALAISQAKKSLDVQSLECKATEGFKRVWDCKINAIINNSPTVAFFRFHRDDKEKLTGEEQLDKEGHQ